MGRRGLGRAKIYMPDFGHRPDRAIIVKWNSFAVTSVYGPADRSDIAWFTSLLDWCGTFKCPTAVVGDFNWRAGYLTYMPAFWTAALWDIQTLVGSKP